MKYIWDDNCHKAFEEGKQSLMKANFLEFYDPVKPIVVVTDASGYGLGGVIAHIIDEVEKPICFTSFSLTLQHSCLKNGIFNSLDLGLSSTNFNALRLYRTGRDSRLY